jgi:GTP-binding protein HflX
MEDVLSMHRARRKMALQHRNDNQNGGVVIDEGRDDDDNNGRGFDVNIGLTWTLGESMVKMGKLIKTSGLVLKGEIVQRLQEVNPKTYIGTGKVGEVQALLKLINKELKQNGKLLCCTVVFNTKLMPEQQRAPENPFNCKVIENDFLADVDDNEVVKVVGQTALILDIFAQHACTREGKLQVHEYHKPHLTKMWTHLKRQSGSRGVGLRGPWETQL